MRFILAAAFAGLLAAPVQAICLDPYGCDEKALDGLQQPAKVYDYGVAAPGRVAPQDSFGQSLTLPQRQDYTRQLGQQQDKCQQAIVKPLGC